MVDDDEVAVAAEPAGVDHACRAAAAAIGVPCPTAMSIPSCIRPQRQPKRLVTGAGDGPAEMPLPTAGRSARRRRRRRACAARICAASSALCASSAVDLLGPSARAVRGRASSERRGFAPRARDERVTLATSASTRRRAPAPPRAATPSTRAATRLRTLRRLPARLAARRLARAFTCGRDALVLAPDRPSSSSLSTRSVEARRPEHEREHGRAVRSCRLATRAARGARARRAYSPRRTRSRAVWSVEELGRAAEALLAQREVVPRASRAARVTSPDARLEARGRAPRRRSSSSRQRRPLCRSWSSCRSLASSAELARRRAPSSRSPDRRARRRRRRASERHEARAAQPATALPSRPARVDAISGVDFALGPVRALPSIASSAGAPRPRRGGAAPTSAR